MNVYAEPGGGLQQIGGVPPEGWVLMTEERPGHHHIAAEDGTWIERPEFPAPVSRYQGREAMRLTPYPKEGRPDWSLFDAFEELLNDPATPAYYRRAWAELQAFEWGSAMLHAAADVLGLTLAQRLDLFGLAATLKA
ncbi:MAG: hypothetical protein ACWGIK_11255 [Achromobacter pulmonis]